MTATLYVENLSHDVSDKDLTEVFSSLGEVVDIAIHRSWGSLEVCGYITMKDARCAQRAAHYLNGHALNGQPMVVTKTNKVICRGHGRDPTLLQ